MEICNAKIVSTFLGVEGHGILTCQIHVGGEAWGQAFGGYGLDEPILDENDKFVCRRGAAFGMEWINQLLKTLDVSSYEKLPGTIVRVRYAGTRYSGSIEAIGHALKEQWFAPKELAEEMGI